MKSNILGFMDFTATYDEANIIFFGVPYDGTATFRPGSRFGPNSIRKYSYGLESYSPYMDKDLVTDVKVFDFGDLEVIYGDCNRTLKNIENYVAGVLNDGKMPLMIGGEHLITLGALSAFKEKYTDLIIIHIDAHADLRDEYLGDVLSHSTVIKRAWNLFGDKSIYQFGIRSGTKEEFLFSEEHLTIEKYTCKSIDRVLNKIKDRPVYLTIDLDVLDPSIMSGTGTPEPGGISFQEMIEFIHSFKGVNVVGSDVVELAPDYDHSGVSTMAAVKIIRELILTLE